MDFGKLAREAREKRAAVIADNSVLLKKAEDEKRDLTAEEQAAFDGRMAESKALLERAERLEAQATAEATLTQSTGRVTAATEDAGNQASAIEPKPLKIPATARRSVRGYKGADAAERAYRDGVFYAAALFGFGPARKRAAGLGIALRENTEIQATLTEGVNTAGGFLVPEETEASIIDMREEFGVMRRIARLRRMASDTLLVNRKTGGLTAYFVGEGSAGTDSQPAWDQVRLTAKTLQTQTPYTMELSEDAYIDIASDITRDISMALAEKEDDCGINGTGASTYGGIVGLTVKINDGNHAASIHTAAAGNTAFSTLDMFDFEECIGKLPMFPGIRPAWLISQLGWATAMARLKYAQGGTTPGDVAGATGLEFLGYPVVISQKMNATSGADVSAIKVLFGDYAMSSSFGDRRGIAVMTDPYTAMNQRIIKVFASERFDILNHDLGSSGTAGPVIALKTPAA